jgi:hypothetical protein
MDDDRELEAVLVELTETLDSLQDELEPAARGGGFRPPSPGDVARFTDEVAIPAAILVLETNLRALELLQRTIRMANGRQTRSSRSSDGTTISARAEAASRTTLSRLDGALSEIQSAIDGRPPDDDAQELLEEARELRSEIEARLEASERESSETRGHERGSDGDAAEGVSIDVDAELRSIKDDLDEDSNEDGSDGDI